MGGGFRNVRWSATSTSHTGRPVSPSSAHIRLSCAAYTMWPAAAGVDMFVFILVFDRRALHFQRTSPVVASTAVK